VAHEWGTWFLLFNVVLVRQLCAEIQVEKDNGKVEELLSLLRAVLRDDQEEIRDRMAFLSKKYLRLFEESKAAD
jgi:hypothetical protein